MIDPERLNGGYVKDKGYKETCRYDKNNLPAAYMSAPIPVSWKYQHFEDCAGDA